MKHLNISRAITAIVMMHSVGLPTLAHHYEVDGIYYKFIAGTNNTVEVTYRGDSFDSYSDEYTGTVTIPSSITFSGTTYSVTSIGDYAFDGCSGLRVINIPNSVTSIGIAAFGDCTRLRAINIPNSVTSIGIAAFMDCTVLPSVTIPNSVTKISTSTFQGCSGLRAINIPNSVTRISEFAFRDCSGLTSVTIPNSVTRIGESAFEGCSGLDEVNITDLSAWCKIDFIDKYANPLNYAHHLKLNGKEITDLVIPNDVTEIKDYAFYDCNYLTSVTIPNSVTSIGDMAFYFSLRLSAIVTLNPTPPACYSSNSFYSNNYSRATLYVPKDSYAKYIVDEVWGKFTNIKKIETLATSIALSKSSITLDKGASEILIATIVPSNASVKRLVWTSDNPQVATVDQAYVTGIKAGEATITAKAIDGSEVSASCKVTVGVGGVEGVEADDNAVEVARYDIHGRLLSEPVKGINIVKMSDGTVKKIIHN